MFAIFFSARMLGGAVVSAILEFVPYQNQLPMALALIISALLALSITYFTLGFFSENQNYLNSYNQN